MFDVTPFLNIQYWHAKTILKYYFACSPWLIFMSCISLKNWCMIINELFDMLKHNHIHMKFLFISFCMMWHLRDWNFYMDSCLDIVIIICDIILKFAILARIYFSCLASLSCLNSVFVFRKIIKYKNMCFKIAS